MQQDAEKTDWQTIEDNLISQWYYVSKVMGTIISATFPYFTFTGLVEEMRNDPNFKKQEGDTDK